MPVYPRTHRYPRGRQGAWRLQRASSDPLAGLRVGLVSSWRLQEASGTATDSVGSNTLTNNNSVGTAAGPGTFQARSYVRASSQYHSSASTASLQTGALSFTWDGWVYFTSINAGYQGIASKRDGSFFEWQLYLENSNQKLRMYISAGGGLFAEWATVPTIATWYHLVGWIDDGLSTINLRVNGGTPVTTALSASRPSATAAAFQLASDGVGDYLNGRLALAHWWKNRVLTAAEQLQLYNSGAGVLL